MKPKDGKARFRADLERHLKLTAPLRAELARRSLAQMLYDDFIIAELSQDVPFRSALERANATYPTEALDTSEENLVALENRYRFLADMKVIDEGQYLLKQIDESIKELDEKIAATMEQITGPDIPADADADAPAQKNDPSSPGTDRQADPPSSASAAR